MKQGKEVAPKYIWETKRLYRILTNVQYTGSYVAGKRESTQIGSRVTVCVDESEWIIIPDSHPAIVSKEDFARVQDMLNNPKELSPDKPVPSKVSRSCQARIISGERKSSFVPYGYVRDKNCDWAVHDAAASVVREIYNMALKGISAKDISDKLYEAGYPSPSEQRQLNKGYDIHPSNRWLPQAVRSILKDEQYTGMYIAGKSYQIAPDKQYLAPKSEWVRIPDKRPVIIDKEIFDQVQAIRSQSRKNMSRREYLLSGKTKCGCCGHGLSYHGEIVNQTYRCMHTYADPAAECHKMKVSADELESAVMNIIRKQAEVVLASDDLSDFRKASAGEQQAAVFENQINQLVKQRQQCYEQFVSLEIDRDTFRLSKDDYTAQIDKLKNHLTIIRQTERDNDANKIVAALAKDALSDKATPKDIVNALIERVLIFPGNRLEIQWKFANFAENIDGGR